RVDAADRLAVGDDLVREHGRNRALEPERVDVEHVYAPRTTRRRAVVACVIGVDVLVTLALDLRGRSLRVGLGPVEREADVDDEELVARRLAARYLRVGHARRERLMRASLGQVRRTQ